MNIVEKLNLLPTVGDKLDYWRRAGYAERVELKNLDPEAYTRLVEMQRLLDQRRFSPTGLPPVLGSGDGACSVPPR
jgi:hypothetical protein